MVTKMRKYDSHIFFALGVPVIAFAAYNDLFIPSVAPTDPDLGWEWLAIDPAVIEYIKFNFRNQGIWLAGYGFLLMATAVGGMRQKEKWAWVGLWSLPFALVLYVVMTPWTLPILIVPLFAAIGTLLLSRPSQQA